MAIVLTTERREQLHQLLDEMLNQLPAKLENLEEAEQQLQAGLRRLGRASMQRWAESASTASPPPKCPECGRPMRHRGLVRRTLVTVHGAIDLARPRRRGDRVWSRTNPPDRGRRCARSMLRWRGAGSAPGAEGGANSCGNRRGLRRWHDDPRGRGLARDPRRPSDRLGCPGATPVLDWYHLSENVHEAANAVFGEGTEESQAWAKSRLDELWEGQQRSARQAVAELRKSVRSPCKREALRKLGVYLKNNAERMDYPRYRALEFPIGSGPVESACKTLVGGRCKQAGMRNWRRSGAEAVLGLRAAQIDEEFGALWDARLRRAA